MSRVLVTGCNGQLGRDVVAAAAAAGHEVTGVDRGKAERFELTEPDTLRAVVARHRPDVIVHAAAWTAVDDCEGDPEHAVRCNATATGTIGEAADEIGAHVLFISTDYVFDGTKAGPYIESDRPNPRSAYGRSKLLGERSLAPHHTVVRTSWLCGRGGPNMVKTILRLADAGGPLAFVDDQVGHPTFAADLASGLVTLSDLRPGGTVHLTNQGAVSWFGFAAEVLAAAGRSDVEIRPIATADLQPPRPAPRPANSVLENATWRSLGLAPLPDFRVPLADLVGQLQG